MELKAKGKGFLRVTGILMIIGGGLSIIVGLFVLFMVGFFTGNITSDTDVTAVVLGTAIIALAILLVGSILELIAGIIGVSNANKPEHSLACLVWGIIVLIIQVLSLILTLASLAERLEAWVTILTCVLSIAIPVLFIIGAGINRSNYKRWKITVKAINEQAKRGAAAVPEVNTASVTDPVVNEVNEAAPVNNEEQN